MKKNFPLQAPGREDARVRDKIRHEVNKYVRRTQRKAPPEGFGRWELACKVGAGVDTASAMAIKEVAGAIDAVALTGASSVYIEILALPARPKPVPAAESEAGSAEDV